MKQTAVGPSLQGLRRQFLKLPLGFQLPGSLLERRWEANEGMWDEREVGTLTLQARDWPGTCDGTSVEPSCLSKPHFSHLQSGEIVVDLLPFWDTSS